MGLSNGAGKEIKVKHGYVFTTFSNDHFSGTSRSYTGKHCRGLFDPTATSIRVACLGNVPFLAKEQLTLNADADGSRALVIWTKSILKTADHYLVERFDGSKNGFAAIGTVQSNGDEVEYLRFHDENPSEGDNIYRVTVVFADGSRESSDYDVVNFASVDEVLVYPNPVAMDFVNLDLSTFVGLAVDVDIFNALGKPVGGLQVASAGYDAERLDISRLAPGNYAIKVQAAGKRQVVKQLVVVRL